MWKRWNFPAIKCMRKWLIPGPLSSSSSSGLGTRLVMNVSTESLLMSGYGYRITNLKKKNGWKYLQLKGDVLRSYTCPALPKMVHWKSQTVLFWRGVSCICWMCIISLQRQVINSETILALFSAFLGSSFQSLAEMERESLGDLVMWIRLGPSQIVPVHQLYLAGEGMDKLRSSRLLSHCTMGRIDRLGPYQRSLVLESKDPCLPQV